MTFISEFKKGQLGKNKGLSMGEGLYQLDSDVNGVQKGMMYAVGAGPKVGKSTFVDYGFVIEPYLDALENDKPLDIIYFSYEIDRVSKEFDFAAHFLARDHEIDKVTLPEGVTVNDEKKVETSANYLRGRIQDDNKNFVPVNENVKEKLMLVHKYRIEPLFGEYDVDGLMIKEGAIKFFEERENPTGLRNHIMDYAERNGKFRKQTVETKNQEGKKVKKKKIIGYTSYNPNKFVIIVTDHLRKLSLERGFFMKQNVDKFVEYSVEFRNWCAFTFVHIIHLNRGLSDTRRLEFADSDIFPNGDDFKDTGNLSEEADYVFTLMNPNDGKYNLNKHFGKIIKDKNKNLLYPNMRTIHLVESRHCTFPLHYRVNMIGSIKKFSRLITNEESYENQV